MYCIVHHRSNFSARRLSNYSYRKFTSSKASITINDMFQDSMIAKDLSEDIFLDKIQD
jgi:hypothetical protein